MRQAWHYSRRSRKKKKVGGVVTISMEWGWEERPSSEASERARSRTLQTWAASCEASFPFIVFSTKASAAFLTFSILCSLPPTPHLPSRINNKFERTKVVGNWNISHRACKMQVWLAFYTEHVWN